MRVIFRLNSASLSKRLLPNLVALLCLTVPDGSVPAQQQETQRSPQSSERLERKLDAQSPEQTDDVVRVRTDLVQTSVAVFDKRGKFVDNLRAEDFEIRIDGQPLPILFFDRIVNGVANAAAQPNRRNNIAGMMAPEQRTRTVWFFVDDLHLSAESMVRTRKMLSNYIEKELGENDEAVIVSASGQLGFLQQLSSEKNVLRAAVERLKYRPQNLLDAERPRMTIYQALAIEQNDAEVLKYFADALLTDRLAAVTRTNPRAARNIAEQTARSRAGNLVRQADMVARQTLGALASAARSSSQAPGRKLFVFVSDGFLLSRQNTEIRDRLQRITDAAVHAGAVVYTIQASGLNTTFPDASADVILVPGTGTGRVEGEDIAAQDPLTQLAADTGGKAILNKNDLDIGLKSALQESNDYYLLAWKPEAGFATDKNFHHIEVAVKGYPDLSVLVQRGFFSAEKPASIVPAKVETAKSAGDFQVEDLAAAIKGKVKGKPLQTSLIANYLDVPNHGAQLSILMQVDRLLAEPANGDKAVDVAGVVYDESGKVVKSFVESLRPEKSSSSQHITYLNQFDVKPGLYQVRGAARDSAGSTGVAMQWIKVPDLGSRNLTLSSLLIGEREITRTPRSNDADEFHKALLKINRRFVSSSHLRFLTYIYNATPATANQPPRLNARVDLFQGNKPVVSSPLFSVETKGVADAARIPYAGELNLASLPKGHYRIRVTVIDLSAKAYASQETPFEIE